MELVLDASILFTALIGTGITKDIIFSKEVTLYAPEYLFEEFAEHKARVEELSGLTPNDFNSLLEKLKLVIKPVPKERFEKFLTEAHKMVPAEGDTEYVALSLSMKKLPIWSNDMHFKKQSAIKTFYTADLVVALKSSDTSL